MNWMLPSMRLRAASSWSAAFLAAARTCVLCVCVYVVCVGVCMCRPVCLLLDSNQSVAVL